ncbi:MAG: ATP-binding response regulator [Candidatus Polarisedimenticolia bacterium]
MERPSVLIADNNQLFLAAVGDLYREMGYEVRTARDGIEALEELQRRRPDLMVLDLIMPRIDGGQLCAMVKGKPELSGVRVIILSGILADEIQDARSIGADAYIAKMPFEQIALQLREVSAALLERPPGSVPLIQGFDRMYRREVVLELLQERRTRRAILDSLSEGILELSDDGRLLGANRAFERIVGRPESAMLSRPLDEIFPSGAAGVRAMMTEASQGTPVIEATLDHEERILQVKLHRLRPDEAPDDDEVIRAMREAASGAAGCPADIASGVGYTLLVQDVTQKVKADRDRERLRARLAHSEKMSAIGLLVSGLAHELNNPLTSVLGYAQLLLQRHKDPSLVQELERIADGATRCRGIVENLLVFARSVRPARVRLDVNELLLEAVASHRDRLQDIGADLSLELGPDLPAISVDRAQVTQALEHVVDNAARALAAWPGPRSLSIGSSVRGGRVHIEIADSGPGIPDEIAGQIFEPFFTTREVGKGSGLGLSASYGIVTAHGGRIQVSSGPRKGATVKIDLPVAAEGAPESEAPAPHLASGSRRILIVDDEAVVLELLADLLEVDQHRIDTAASGREGLEKLLANDYDLVVLDLRMPDMPGQQVYERLAHERPALLRKLMFITADTLTGESRGFLEGTRRPWLQKPFSIDAFMKQARSILS